MFNRRLLVLQVLMFVGLNYYRKTSAVIHTMLFLAFLLFAGEYMCIDRYPLGFEIILGQFTLYFCYLVEPHKLS